jgi:predicted component of type VI protein secretion system
MALNMSKRALTIDDLQPKAASQSPFFQLLPREIRDNIYQYLWQDTPKLRQRYKQLADTVSYGEVNSLRETEHPKVRLP